MWTKRNVAEAASNETEYAYWVRVLALKITGYINKQRNSYRQGGAPDQISATLANIVGFVHNEQPKDLKKVFDFFTRKTKAAHPNLIEKPDIAKIKIKLVSTKYPGPAKVGAWWDGWTIIIPIITEDGKINFVHHTLVMHELRHAFDDYLENYEGRERCYSQEDRLSYDKRERSYYLDMTEVKARMTEMNNYIHSVLSYVLAMLKEDRDSLNEAVTRHSLRSFSLIKKVAKNRENAVDFFSKFFKSRKSFHKSFMAKEHKFGDSTINKLPRDLAIFVDYVEQERAQADTSSNSENINYKSSIQYIDNYLDKMYKDLTARYKNVVATEAFQQQESNS